MAIEIVDFPIHNMVIFHCYVSSPEGTINHRIQPLTRHLNARTLHKAPERYRTGAPSCMYLKIWVYLVGYNPTIRSVKGHIFYSPVYSSQFSNTFATEYTINYHKPLFLVFFLLFDMDPHDFWLY